MNQQSQHEASHAGRIGPNAIIRVAEALEAAENRAAVEHLFTAAGLAHYLDAMPDAMVDEREVSRLQTALREQLGIARARAISRDAGRRTGDYLLAHRIPKPAQRLLKLLPAGLASQVLIKAIGKNAWTFAGSGHFSAAPGKPVRLTIQNGPICAGAKADEPLCDFYAGTFERLFRVLVQRETQVTETACQAQGAEACVFEARW
ncbi:MAG: bacteriochlorophyll 4-vinyl reductase [Chromatiaceae bacterium]|nr:bacteriochlorophyll 4-vinyl reductase [Chromatiaceae bacterium]